MRGILPNSLDRNVQWKELIEKRGELRQKRVDKKQRSVGKKQVFEIDEIVKLQNLKTKQWDQEGKIVDVRVSADGTIVSNDIESQGVLTSRHLKYLMKQPTQAYSADGDVSTVAGSPATTHVSLRAAHSLKAAQALESSFTVRGCCQYGVWVGDGAKHL